MAFGSESDSSESDGSTSPEPDDPDYALSGPHVHNEMTLESKWPFSNVFESDSWARTCPYLIETTSDTICFFVRSLPGPRGDFFTLGINTKGQKHSHVLLFQFILVSDWTHSRYKTKRYIVHFSLKDSFWLNKTFLSVEEANNWFQIARNENVTFVMSMKYNIDHDYICHEPGHVKTTSCRLAKKRFKKCPPQRLTSLNTMFLPGASNSSGGFPGMVKVRDERDQSSRALVKLPPFDTLLKKPYVGELVGSNVNWLVSKPSPVNTDSFFSNQRLMHWNGPYMRPIVSRAAGQLEGSVRSQGFDLNRERQELAHLLNSQWGGRKMDSVPRLSYHTPRTVHPALKSTASQPPVSYATPGTSGWRPPNRTTAPVWTGPNRPIVPIGPNVPNRTIGPSGWTPPNRTTAPVWTGPNRPIVPIGPNVPNRTIGPSGWTPPNRTTAPVWSGPNRPIVPIGPNVTNRTIGPSGWRPPNRTTAPVWSGPNRPIVPIGPNVPNRTIGPSGSRPPNRTTAPVWSGPNRPIVPIGPNVPNRTVGPSDWGPPNRTTAPVWSGPNRPIVPIGPNVPNRTVGPSDWGPPNRTTAPVWSGPNQPNIPIAPNVPNRMIGPSTSTLPHIPPSAPANFHLPPPPQLTKPNRHQSVRRRARRRIIITCGNDRFFINSKILEDASPVVKAFMTYWTPLPDPNGDIFLEIAGVTSIALENLLKYLTNDSFNHGVMRSTHMKELTRKLKIDINLV